MIVPAGIIKIFDTVWELPVTVKKGMRLPARIIATQNLLAQMDEGGFDQVAAEARGEPIDRHRLIVDVKAVTMHCFKVEETPEGWSATVVLDI